MQIHFTPVALEILNIIIFSGWETKQKNIELLSVTSLPPINTEFVLITAGPPSASGSPHIVTLCSSQAEAQPQLDTDNESGVGAESRTMLNVFSSPYTTF